jgi:SAM-dependent methyltransferase
VNVSALDAEDVQFLLANGRQGRAEGCDHLLHLDQPVGAWNYIRIANEIAERFRGGRLLDWGCGFGQMSYLLKRRGFDVTAFDVGSDVNLPALPLIRAITIQRTTHPTTLPFADASFDVVLSCGVLEHVDEYSEPGNERRSLAEIRRVLKPDAHFSIYQLPQRWSWQEAVTRTLGIGYSHPRRFSESEIRALLKDAGFVVEDVRRNNLLPKNLTGTPRVVRNAYGSMGRILIDLDSGLSKIPLVNRFAGVLELTARRT